MKQAVLFSKFPKDFIGGLTPRLVPYGIEVAKVLNFERVRNPSLEPFDVVLFMHEMAATHDRTKIEKLAAKAGKPLVCLPRREAQWSRLLEPLMDPAERPLVNVRRRPTGPTLTKATPGAFARVAVAQSHPTIPREWAEEPEVPPSAPELPVPPEGPPPDSAYEPSPVDVDDLVPPAPPISGLATAANDDHELAKLIEEENAELRRLNRNQEEMIARLGARIHTLETNLKAVGVLAKSPPPEDWRQAASHLRALVVTGFMDGVQALDVLAGQLGLA